VKIVQKCWGQDWFNCELFALQNEEWQNPNLTLNALLILNLVEFSMIVTNVNNTANKNLQVGLMIIIIYCAVKCTIRRLEPEAGRKKIKNNQH
jgi:hypothetical protein